jgi:hypothetical protein
MKFTSIITGALAAVAATAAPAPKVEERSVFNQNQIGLDFGGAFDVNGFNNLAFANQGLAYLAQLNFVDQNVLLALIQQQNLGFDNFQNAFLFNQGGIGNFGINELLQLQSLALLSWFGRNNLISGIDFAGVQIPNVLDFGLLQNNFAQLGNFNFGIDQFLGNQIATIVQQTQISTVVIKE